MNDSDGPMPASPQFMPRSADDRVRELEALLEDVLERVRQLEDRVAELEQTKG